MKQFEPKTFTIPTLAGISQKNIDEHLKLYAGYVKHANLILQKVTELSGDMETHSYTVGELRRRFGFEFDGMRNHEYYFASFEGGPAALQPGALRTALEVQFGSYEAWLAEFKALALTRGIGWAMLYFDKTSGNFLHAWIDEQHLGHLTALQPVLALDMWEHSFVYDYPTSEKKKYVEAFFENLNWSVIEQNFVQATA